jgi:hypothetical protein
MLRLRAFHDDDLLTFPLPEGEATLGRDPGNDLVLPFVGVSRRHGLVQRCPGGIVIVDQRSKNGLLVAGRRVERARLTPGLRVQIGAAWLELEEVSSAEDALSRLAAGTLGMAVDSAVTSDEAVDSRGPPGNRMPLPIGR